MAPSRQLLLPLLFLEDGQNISRRVLEPCYQWTLTAKNTLFIGLYLLLIVMFEPYAAPFKLGYDGFDIINLEIEYREGCGRVIGLAVN